MDFSILQNFIETEYREKRKIPGCHIIVMQDHEVLWRYRSGFMDQYLQKPVSEKDLYYIYSCSKPTTCAAALQLIEGGQLELDAPVGDILPAYKNVFLMQDEKPVPAERTMTVRHLFTMSGGLDYLLGKEPIKREAAKNSGTLDIVNAFVESPLRFEPGERYKYSLCHDVLGAIVEVVSGMKFSDYLRKNIWEPLGMTRTGFFPSAEEKENFAFQFTYSKEKDEIVPAKTQIPTYRLTENYESGGAGLYSCVDDYILFLDAMSCGGVGKTGAQILKPETIDLMRTDQTGIYTAPDGLEDYKSRLSGYGYGLGVRTRIEKTDGQRGPLGEFGWPGAAGSFTMMDPANKLSVFYTMSVQSYKSLIGNHFPLRNAIYEAMGLE